MKKLTEEDIRTLVVTAWLSEHGFQESEISLEYSFEVQLGRYAYKIGEKPNPNNNKSRKVWPRSDVLVRRDKATNIL